MTAMAQRLRWRRGAGRPDRWRPRRVFVVVAAVLVAVMAVGVSAVLVGQGRGRSGSDESAVGTAASPMAPPYSVAPVPEAASGRAGAADAAAAPSPAKSGVPDKSVPLGAGRDLVRTGQLTLDVDDVAARGRQVRTAATAVGGVVVQEQSGDDYASLTVRVPVDSMDKVTDDVAGLGKVTARSAQVTDATGDVVDLDARVRSQQASVDRVRALLAQATSIGDVVSIESELASREADLDSLTGRLAALRDQVAMSTLTVDLRGPAAAPVPVEDPSPAGWSEGLAAGWAGLQAVGTATAAVAGFLLPMLPLVAVVLGLVWAVRRVVRGRRPAPPAGAPAPAPTPTT